MCSRRPLLERIASYMFSVYKEFQDKLQSLSLKIRKVKKSLLYMTLVFKRTYISIMYTVDLHLYKDMMSLFSSVK